MSASAEKFQRLSAMPLTGAAARCRGVAAPFPKGIDSSRSKSDFCMEHPESGAGQIKAVMFGAGAASPKFKLRSRKGPAACLLGFERRLLALDAAIWERRRRRCSGALCSANNFRFAATCAALAAAFCNLKLRHCLPKFARPAKPGAGSL